MERTSSRVAGLAALALTFVSSVQAASTSVAIPAVAPAPATRAITVDDVIALQQLGFTSDIMIMIINYTESRFLLSTNDILRLQAEGVPFKVINYMIRM